MANQLLSPEAEEPKTRPAPAANPYDAEASERGLGSGQPDLGPGHNAPADDPSDPRGDREKSDDLGDIKQGEKNGDGLYNPRGDSGVDGLESGLVAGNGRQKAESKRDGLYNPGNRRRRDSFMDAIRRHRGKIALSASGIAALIGIAGSSFFSLGSLNLANFMANIEKKGFARYQVDLNGRSSKWLESYMLLRFGEIDDPKVAPQDRDNIIFRSDKIDRNNPVFDWYRTLRASKFEQEVFEKHGIRFSSIAYRDGNIIKFRPAKVIVDDNALEVFDPKTLGYNELDALSTGDVNNLNGRLKNAITIQKLESDAAARKEISALLRDQYPQWWRAVKRYHLRQDIQNMIGVRKWTFFESKRQDLRENAISRRNKLVEKVVNQTLPEDSKAGKFVECFFGTTNCEASTDPANPDNNALKADGTAKEEKKVKSGNGDSDVPVDDGSAKTGLKSAADSAAVARETISKLFKGANALQIVDALAKFDQAVKDHKLSKLVTQAKGQYVVGLYSVFKVADDQAKTGQMNNQEFNDFMSQYPNLSNGEGWATVVDPQFSATSAAAAKKKRQFCSEKNQNEMAKPQNLQASRAAFQWNCPQDQVGGATNASSLEDTWNNGPGAVLHPVLAAFESTAGALVDVFNAVTGAITDAAISAVGLGGTLEDVTSWGAQKAIQIAGANMDVTSQTPPGRVGNLALEGSAQLAETTMRDQGGAQTTSQTAALATRNYLAYQQDERQNSSLSDRYLSLSNPDSLLSRQAISIGGLRPTNVFLTALQAFGSALSNLFKVFTLPTLAANKQDDGYAAARFTGIETNDLPSQCLDSDPLTMAPDNATNAVDLGIFQPGELTWDTMTDKQTWYSALYDKLKAKNGDDTAKNEAIAKQVWNCALFDNTVRGGIGALYGYKGRGAFGGDSNSGSSQTPAPANPAASGDAQQLAQQIQQQAKAGKIKFNVLNGSDQSDGSTPEANIQEVAAGKPANTSTRCGGNGAPSKTTDLNPKLLQFILDLSNTSSVPVQINALAGQCHSSSNSNHYKGVAVDLGCPTDATAANKIGDKYGISDKTGETCANSGHYHYSIGGL